MSSTSSTAQPQQVKPVVVGPTSRSHSRELDPHAILLPNLLERLDDNATRPTNIATLNQRIDTLIQSLNTALQTKMGYRVATQHLNHIDTENRNWVAETNQAVVARAFEDELDELRDDAAITPEVEALLRLTFAHDPVRAFQYLRRLGLYLE